MRQVFFLVLFLNFSFFFSAKFYAALKRVVILPPSVPRRIDTSRWWSCIFGSDDTRKKPSVGNFFFFRVGVEPVAEVSVLVTTLELTVGSI